MRKQLNKNRKILDTEVSISTLLQHAGVNFLFGLTSSVVILSLSFGIGWVVFLSYYIHKQLESKILNRNKYTSKFGKYYLFPIPSTLGFFIGWFLTKSIKL